MLCDGTSGEIVVVRGTEDKYAFHSAWINVPICVGCCRALHTQIHKYTHTHTHTHTFVFVGAWVLGVRYCIHRDPVFVP